MLSTVLADDITWSSSQSHTKATIIERMFYSYQFTKAFSYQRPDPASSTSCLSCRCFSQSSSCKQTPWRRRLGSPQPRSPERLTHHFLLIGNSPAICQSRKCKCLLPDGCRSLSLLSGRVGLSWPGQWGDPLSRSDRCPRPPGPRHRSCP